MKWKILFFLITSGLFARAQTVEQTYQFANEQFVLQNYNAAIKAYQRVLFFSQDNDILFPIYRNMGESFMSLGQQDKALSYFDMAYFATDQDSLQSEIIFSKSTALLLDQKYNLALSEIYNLEEPVSPYFSQKRDFYSAVAYFGAGDYERSQEYFMALIPANKVEQRAALQQLFDENAKVSRINPKTAKILSIILPGAGQFYIGDIKNGLNSLLLTGGLVFLIFNYANVATFWDAMLSIFPWLFRYYLGGFTKAEELAIKKKQERRAEIYGEIIELMYQIRQNEELKQAPATFNR